MSELLANFHFLRPAWLLAALPILPLGWLLYRQLGAGKAWSSIISDQLLPHLLSSGRVASRWPLTVVLAAWLLAVIALAGPSWERLPQPVERREHALVVLYDLSLSMYATDITPSRLVRSRQKLLDLLEKKTEGTTGLIAYAGDAHVVSPLTDDLRTIANLMPALTPGIMPTSGSRPARAVDQAVRLLRDSGLEHGQILLVTDGVHRGDDKEIAEALQKTGYRLSVLGVGTSEGSPIPTGEGFLRDDKGSIVVANLDREPLKALAARFGGSYSDLELGDDDLEQILALDPWGEDETQQLLGRSVDTWEDMGYWLALLLIPVVLGAFRRGYILCLLLLPLAEPSEAQPGAARPDAARPDAVQPYEARGLRDYFLNRDQRGQQLLQAEQPEAAAEVFMNPEWAATANYRAGNYEQALELYQQGEGADSWYNRGNSLARSGDLEQAIAAYEQALEIAPDMEDAAFNKALLEQLLEQQEQQNQQDQLQSQDQQQQQDQQQSQQQQDSAQDQQQQAQQEQSESQQQQDQQEQQAEQQQREQQQADAQQSEQEAGEPQQQAARERDPDELEREMANEQWLRRIPDDPSGLLRRKFRYESRLRAQENKRGSDRDDETRW